MSANRDAWIVIALLALWTVLALWLAARGGRK